MSDYNQLNSTEQLLNTIRTGNPPETNSDSPAAMTGSSSMIPQALRKKAMQAGVLIEEKMIVILMIGKMKAGIKPEPVKWACIDIPADLTIEHPRFPAFLKTTLDQFLGSLKHCELWSAVDTKNLKLRNITIPDLPEAKLANAAMWGFKKEFEIVPEKEIFDFRITGDADTDGVKKKKAIAFSGEKAAVRQLKRIFRQAGYPLTGITALPFAFQHFAIKGLIQMAEPYVVANISKHHSNIFCFSKGMVLLVRNVRTGAFSLLEDILEIPSDQIDPETDISAHLHFGPDDPAAETIRESSFRLISKIVRTGDYCSHQVAENIPMAKYFLFGETDQCEAFNRSAENQIPGAVEIFNPFESSQAQIPLKLDLPQHPSLLNMLVQCYAVSLSNREKTPNFLRTYIHKQQEAARKKVQAVLAISCTILLTACFVLWFWMGMLETDRKNQITAIQAQLAAFQPMADRDSVNLEIAAAEKKADRIEQFRKDYLPIACISEICNLTPDSIFLSKMAFEFHPAQHPTQRGKDTGPQPPLMKLSGRLLETKDASDSTLTSYMIRLGDSPFFNNPVLEKEGAGQLDAENSHSFHVSMEVM